MIYNEGGNNIQRGRQLHTVRETVTYSEGGSDIQ